MNTDSEKHERGEMMCADAKEVLAAMAAEAAELEAAAGGPVTDMLVRWLAGQLALRVKKAAVEAGEAGLDLKMLHNLSSDAVALRHGDHTAARLELDREHLAWVRKKGELNQEKEFRKWIKRADVRRKYFPKTKPGLSKRAIKQIQKATGLL